MNIDLIIYGIKRGDGRFDRNYQKLSELLKYDFDINTIEIINDIEMIDNPRSGEIGIIQNKRQYFEDSRVVLKSYKRLSDYELIAAKAKKFSDVHQDSYRSVENLIQQLLMLRDGLLLSENKFILTIRDDIIFAPSQLSNSIKKFIKICSHENSFLTSFFHSNTGLSERFMLTQNPGSAVLLNRVGAISDFLFEKNQKQYRHSNGLNGEWLARYVSENKKLVPICAPIFTKRIRTSGIQKESMFTAPHRWVHELNNLEGLRKFIVGKDK